MNGADPLRIGVVGIDPQNVHLLTYVRYCAQCGHDVTVITNRPEVDAPVKVCDFTASRRLSQSLPRGIRLIPRLWRLRRCLHRGRFDVLNVQQVTPDGVYAALLWNGPLVLGFWGSDIHRLENRPWLVRRLMPTAIRRSTAIHSVSQEMSRLLVRHGADPGLIQTFQYGVDLEAFPLGPSARHEPLIVSSRGLGSFYRVEQILRALPIVLERRPQARLLVMGPGDDAHLRALAAGLGIEDRVRFAGMVDQTALAEQLQSAQVWVSLPPSDGTPLSLLEAMASGAVPVVADTPSLREWIDEATGVLIVDVDPEGVAAGILKGFTLFDTGMCAATNRATVRGRADRAVNLPRWERMLCEAAATRRPASGGS
jgi:glycosyltransferase involved in cell wall biosynthesis